jgi:heme/copper-type cytochrome/quinol oxidase subunit 3
VSGLPTVVFGHRSMIWLGTVGLMAIEGTMFAILIATYFYLRTRVTEWPPGVSSPALTFGTLNTIIYLASIVPNHWTKKVAEKGDARKARTGILIMCVIAVANIVVRVFEFPSLNCGWDSNAYGSAIWTLLGLHTVHLLTDAFDTFVLAALIYQGNKIEGRRFMDVSENADYWYFVVGTWLPIYFVIYIAPRIL